ncbi:MAG: GNAT family N-acetyltransferase [Flavipsychrobacter sp.]
MMPGAESQSSIVNTSVVTIRKARKEDCSRMLELVHELAVYERAPHEVTVSLEHFIESGFGNQPVWWAFVAEVDHVIVGFALYYIRYSTWKGQRMYLEDILVTEAWRGKGIGGLLMNALQQEAKDRNFVGITWQVLEWNEPAIRFYQRYTDRFDAEWINVSLDTL